MRIDLGGVRLSALGVGASYHLTNKVLVLVRNGSCKHCALSRYLCCRQTAGCWNCLCSWMRCLMRSRPCPWRRGLPPQPSDRSGLRVYKWHVGSGRCAKTVCIGTGQAFSHWRVTHSSTHSPTSKRGNEWLDILANFQFLFIFSLRTRAEISRTWVCRTRRFSAAMRSVPLCCFGSCKWTNHCRPVQKPLSPVSK